MTFIKIPVDEVFGGRRMSLSGKQIEQTHHNIFVYASSKRSAQNFFKRHAELSPNCSNCGKQESFKGKTRREVSTKLHKAGWRKDDTYKNMTVHHCGDCC